MRLEWSVFAQADREAIFDYIEADSPQAAVRVDERIQAQVEQLQISQRWAAPGGSPGRELVISRTPYIALIALRRDTVRILRVLHGAQLGPEKMHDKSSVKHVAVIY